MSLLGLSGRPRVVPRYSPWEGVPGTTPRAVRAVPGYTAPVLDSTSAYQCRVPGVWKSTEYHLPYHPLGSLTGTPNHFIPNAPPRVAALSLWHTALESPATTGQSTCQQSRRVRT